MQKWLLHLRTPPLRVSKNHRKHHAAVSSRTSPWPLANLRNDERKNNSFQGFISSFSSYQNHPKTNPRVEKLDSFFQETALAVKSWNNMKKSSRKASWTKSKERTAKFEAMKPKKPPTAFFYFLEDFREEYQEQNPDVKSMRDIGKACGQKGKTMTYEEKVHYSDVATQKRAEFDRAMADYVKRKESGMFEEDSEDSEFVTMHKAASDDVYSLQLVV